MKLTTYVHVVPRWMHGALSRSPSYDVTIFCGQGESIMFTLKSTKQRPWETSSSPYIDPEGCIPVFLIRWVVARYQVLSSIIPGPRLVKKTISGPRSHEGWELLLYAVRSRSCRRTLYWDRRVQPRAACFCSYHDHWLAAVSARYAAMLIHLLSQCLETSCYCDDVS